MRPISHSESWETILQKGWVAWTAITLAVLAVYLPSLNHAFQYDDLHSIVENSHLRTLYNLDDFFTRPDMFTADAKSAMYRPLVLVSYAFNYALGGYQVAGYHWLNIALHWANCLLVRSLMQRLSGLWSVGLASGLLFALHPIAGEPVNYISSRSESLCAFFILISLLQYIRARERASLMPYLCSLSAFACALLAKSVGIIVPLVLAVRDATAEGVSARRLLHNAKYHLLFWLVGLAYAAGVRQALQTALIDRPVRGLSVQIFTQVKALVYYLKLLLVPWGQSVEHQFVLADGIGDGAVLAALALLGSLAFCLFLLWHRSRWLFFGCVWPALFLLPTFVVPLNVLANEHRLYIPAMGLTALLAWVLVARVERRQGLLVLGLLIASYAGLSRNRSQVWQTPATLWADALDRAPRMPRPHIFTGDVYRGQGRNIDALESYQRALTVNPESLSGGDLLVIHNNIGATYLAMGHNEQAMASYRRAIAIDPDFAKARDALEALQALASVAWHPEAEKRYKAGLKMVVAGMLEQAIAELSAALQFQRRPRIYQALALAYERSGQTAAAIEAYRALLRLPSVKATLAQNAHERLAELATRQGEFD